MNTLRAVKPKTVLGIIRRRILTALFLILSIAACEPPPRSEAGNTTRVTEADKFITSDKLSPDEEYVMVTTAINMPLYVNHDQAAFTTFC